MDNKQEKLIPIDKFKYEETYHGAFGVFKRVLAPHTKVKYKYFEDGEVF